MILCVMMMWCNTLTCRATWSTRFGIVVVCSKSKKKRTEYVRLTHGGSSSSLRHIVAREALGYCWHFRTRSKQEDGYFLNNQDVMAGHVSRVAEDCSKDPVIRVCVLAMARIEASPLVCQVR